MVRDSRYIQIAYSIQRALADDGILDAQELEELLGMALCDGMLDDDERRILSLILNKLKPKDVTPSAWKRMEEVKQKYGL